MTHSERIGLILALVSAATFSTAGLFTKGVEASAWAVIFWRGLAAAGFTFGWLALRGRLREDWAQMAGPGFLAALLGAIGTSAFIPAFKLTTMTNVTLIWATAPLLTALIGWFWLREAPGWRVLVGGAACIVGVLLVTRIPSPGGSLVGDLLAGVMTLMMSLVILIYRRWPATPAATPAALSSLFLLPPAFVFDAPLLTVRQEIAILIAFGLIFALASVTLGEAARRLSGARVALISMLEVPLALIWAMAFFGEWLTLAGAVGAALILAAVFWTQR